MPINKKAACLGLLLLSWPLIHMACLTKQPAPTLSTQTKALTKKVIEPLVVDKDQHSCKTKPLAPSAYNSTPLPPNTTPASLYQIKRYKAAGKTARKAELLARYKWTKRSRPIPTTTIQHLRTKQQVYLQQVQLLKARYQNDAATLQREKAKLKQAIFAVQ